MKASPNDITPRSPKGSSPQRLVKRSFMPDSGAGREDVLEYDNSKTATLSAPMATTVDDIQTSKRIDGVISHAHHKAHRAPKQHPGGGLDNNVENIHTSTRDVERRGSSQKLSYIERVKRKLKKTRDRVKRIFSRRKTQPPRTEFNIQETIQLKFRQNNREQVFIARVQFDSLCDANLISRDFVESCGYTFESNEATEVLSQPGGNRFRSIGVIDCGWVPHALIDPDSRELKFPEKFMNATFYVSECNEEHFEVIIGKMTMKKYNMYSKLLLAAANFGFRKTRAAADSASNASASENQKKKFEQNTADIEAHEAQKKRKAEEDERKNKEATQSS